MFRVNCPNCGNAIEAPDDYAGKEANCPHCRQPFTLPEAGAAAAGETVAELPMPGQASTTGRANPTQASYPRPQATKSSNTGTNILVGCLIAFSLMCVGGCVVIGWVSNRFLENMVESVERMEQQAQAQHKARMAKLQPVFRQITVTNPRIDAVDDGASPNRLFATFQNDSDVAIQTITAECTYQSESREIPWAEGAVYFSFPGGLEPGETKEVEGFVMDYNSELENVALEEDAELTLEFTDAEVPSLNLPSDAIDAEFFFEEEFE
ncbi:hypothetical protein [Aeoliella mucimassa]|uniref:Uncharacterized protein n=1 Tax=Aeoliella mucimassa TaxID=2527972 RepID=A0A518AW74_9BACT|nr:hypothetical protein [Aeoliella mucimassa]QDU58956.1 hypothetical protein Pan181_51970 [Aeoliella mucimassa]